MFAKPSIRKDYIWNTLGVLAQNAISPLLLVVITRHNGLVDAGIFSFAFSIAVVFWVIGMWGGRTLQASDAKNEYSQPNYIAARSLMSLVMLIGAILFVVFNHYEPAKSMLIIVLVLLKAIESFADSLYALLQVHNRLYVSGLSLLYKASAGFGVFVLINLYTKNLLLASIGLVLVNALLVCVYDIPRAKKFESLTPPLKGMRSYFYNSYHIIKHTTPTFLILFLSVLALNIPRYFLDKYHEDKIGYFGIMAMPVTLIGLVMSFVLQPSVVNLSKLYLKQNYKNFQYIIQRLIFFVIGASAFILLLTYWVGPFMFGLVFHSDFTTMSKPLMIIVAGGVLNALVSILMNVLIIMRSFKAQLYILLLTNVVLFGFSAGLVSRYNLNGAVSLYTLTIALQLILLLITYVRTLGIAKRASR